MGKKENKLVDLERVAIDKICMPESLEMQVGIEVLRLDRIHSQISGNKWFKLKYYLRQAQMEGNHTLLTFGGAFSNHIVATAAAAMLSGCSSIGIIRGEKGAIPSHTLALAARLGMKLHFISRQEYRMKHEAAFLAKLEDKFGPCFIIPEGGAGALGIKGSEEMLTLVNLNEYTHILSAMGTGTTFCGLVSASLKSQQLIGIPVLKGIDESLNRISAYLEQAGKNNFRIVTDYHFGGYAKFNRELLAFMNQFYLESGIPTDFVYTGKLFFAVKALLRAKYFPPGSNILIIHSGGLQGNASLPDGSLLF